MMTQEDKGLLLKDLCARLPYGVKVSYHIETNSTICGDYEELDAEGISDISSYKKFNLFIVDGYVASIENIKPYLFPLSSMTEEQKKDIFRNGTFFFDRHNTLCRFPKHNDDYDYATFEDYLEITEKLNKNHFDYRGLIPKGLAIDATGLNIY